MGYFEKTSGSFERRGKKTIGLIPTQENHARKPARISDNQYQPLETQNGLDLPLIIRGS
jgi:hypothetical protein